MIMKVATPSSIWRGLKLEKGVDRLLAARLRRDPFLDLERTETKRILRQIDSRYSRDPFLDLERTETSGDGELIQSPRCVATPSSIWRGLKRPDGADPQSLRRASVATPSSIWRGLKHDALPDVVVDGGRDPFLDLERTETGALLRSGPRDQCRDPFLDLERTD